MATAVIWISAVSCNLRNMLSDGCDSVTLRSPQRKLFLEDAKMPGSIQAVEVPTKRKTNLC